MIIVRVTGGLGNQMFQYAMYKSLEKKGKLVKLDSKLFMKQKRNIMDMNWKEYLILNLTNQLKKI